MHCSQAVEQIPGGQDGVDVVLMLPGDMGMVPCSPSNSLVAASAAQCTTQAFGFLFLASKDKRVADRETRGKG